MIAYKAADLLWATKIKETAEAVGVQARPTRDRSMLEARLGDSDVRALILDLEADGATDLIAPLREAEAAAGLRPARVLAFGPHVKKDALQGARDAGADEVLTNGAFDHDLPGILIRLEGRG